MFRVECVTRAGLLPAIADPPTTPQSDKTPSRAGLLPANADAPTVIRARQLQLLTLKGP